MLGSRTAKKGCARCLLWRFFPAATIRPRPGLSNAFAVPSGSAVSLRSCGLLVIVVCRLQFPGDVIVRWKRRSCFFCFFRLQPQAVFDRSFLFVLPRPFFVCPSPHPSLWRPSIRWANFRPLPFVAGIKSGSEGAQPVRGLGRATRRGTGEGGMKWAPKESWGLQYIIWCLICCRDSAATAVIVLFFCLGGVG